MGLQIDALLPALILTLLALLAFALPLSFAFPFPFLGFGILDRGETQRHQRTVAEHLQGATTRAGISEPPGQAIEPAIVHGRTSWLGACYVACPFTFPA